MADHPTHHCPGGCGGQVAFEMLACSRCWFRLPVALRRALNFCYPRRQIRPAAWEDARTACLAWYRQNPPAREG